LIDQFFRLRENRTDARTEILAGATTFVTLSAMNAPGVLVASAGLVVTSLQSD
jgi:xanthine/uracil/vitamin C permease (AzgA family)